MQLFLFFSFFLILLVYVKFFIFNFFIVIDNLCLNNEFIIGILGGVFYFDVVDDYVAICISMILADDDVVICEVMSNDFCVDLIFVVNDGIMMEVSVVSIFGVVLYFDGVDDYVVIIFNGLFGNSV